MFTKHSAFLFLPTLQNNLIVSKIAGNLTLLTRTEFFLIFCSNVSHYSEAQGAPLINQGKPKWGGTDGCPRCGKAVYFAEEVRALGKKFHKLCLACGTIHFLLWRFTLKFLYMIFLLWRFTYKYLYYHFLAITITSWKKKSKHVKLIGLNIFTPTSLYTAFLLKGVNLV